MLIKQLKYDLAFSKLVFLVLGGFLVLLAIAARVAFAVSSFDYDPFVTITLILGMGITIGVAAVQMYRFFDNSLFGNFGYLTLTLPISRGRLMLSKLLTIGIWFNFIMVIYAIVMLVLSAGHPHIYSPHVSVYFVVYMHSFVVMFFITSVFLLNATMSHSTFGKRHVPSIVNIGATIILVIVYIFVIGQLSRRYMETITTIEYNAYISGIGHVSEASFTRTQAVMSLHAGRLAVGNSHIDLYIVALSLGMGLIALLATHYLLKNRVSL